MGRERTPTRGTSSQPKCGWKGELLDPVWAEETRVTGSDLCEYHDLETSPGNMRPFSIFASKRLGGHALGIYRCPSSVEVEASPFSTPMCAQHHPLPCIGEEGSQYLSPSSQGSVRETRGHKARPTAPNAARQAWSLPSGPCANKNESLIKVNPGMGLLLNIS